MRIPESASSPREFSKVIIDARIPEVSRVSGWVSGENWVYLGVATVVTLLVIWSVWGAILALFFPPSCHSACIEPNQSVYVPVVLGAIVGLLIFYLILLSVKIHTDEAKKRDY